MEQRVMRWKVFLECGHDLASDDIPDFETAELCPECFLYERITGIVAFNDEDISPEFLDESVGQGRR